MSEEYGVWHKIVQGVRYLQEMVVSDYARIGSEFQTTAVKAKWFVVFGIRSIVCCIDVLCDNGSVSIQGKVSSLEQRQCLFASEDVISKFNSKDQMYPNSDRRCDEA